jgi:hypothetical protein
MTLIVMAGHSRPKDGVASLAYVSAIPVREAKDCPMNRDGRDKPGHDEPYRPHRPSAPLVSR